MDRLEVIYYSISAAMKLIIPHFNGDKRNLKEFFNVNFFGLVNSSDNDVLLKFFRPKITVEAMMKLLLVT